MSEPRRHSSPVATVPTPSAGAPSGGPLAVEGHDVRGWDVLTAEGTLVGVVDDLLLFATSHELAALVVLAHGDLIVVSTATAEFDPPARQVRTGLSYAQFATLAQHAVRRAPTAAASAMAANVDVAVEHTADGGQIIRVPIVEEELVVQRRPVVKEVVVIRKRAVVEERVVEAELRRERVDVTGADDGVRGTDTD